ncbi:MULTISPECIES: copper homeostasis membrane protein CopD [Achromobacter]|uniref:Copper homeostasis membrane protein CopD n=1 Tax=Achromobacter spanius TaxID=217203 RepID=A0AA42S7E5_9BURK|nr:copper homeostasis membrane protein CopD [Achromobacter spanius]MDH0740290.1 copper homeostasis membrane protein CopD [Achromobacter spanius]
MDWPTVLVRFALYLDLAMLFGLPLFSMYALREGEIASPTGARFLAVSTALAALGITLSVINIAIMAKSMTGATSYAELQSHVFEMIVTGTDFGAAWLARLGALILCVLVGIFARTQQKFRLGVFSIAGGIALSTLAWGGHGAMDEGVRRYVHLTSDIAHLIAAGAWAGALLAFLLLSQPTATPGNVALLNRTSNGFAQVGTAIVLTLVITGTVNYLLIVGASVPDMSLTSYGGLLVAKLGLFGTMLALAAANRFYLSPRLEHAVRTGDHAIAVLTLRRSLMFESTAATLILLLVAALGVLSPSPMS